MSEPGHDTREQYFRDNEVFVEAISKRIEVLLAESPRTEVVSFDSAQSEDQGLEETGRIISGAVTAEDYSTAYPELNPDDAQHLAEDHNLEIETIAGLSVLALKASAQMFQVASHEERLKSAGATPDRIATFLAEYKPTEPDSALYYSTTYQDSDGTEFALESTELSTSADGVYARSRVVETSDGMLATRLAIDEVDGKTVFLSTNTKPVEDELLRRVVELTTGHEANKHIIMLMMGKVADIDEALSEVWLMYLGTSKEQEVTSLLEDVGNRARAVVDSRQIEFELQAHRPTFEQLKSIIGRLKDL